MATFGIVSTIILMVFGAFFLKVYILQKDYFSRNSSTIQNDQSATNIESKDAPSVYVDYSKDIYDKAISENRIVVLYFTSNWCSKCLDQDLVNKSVFETLNTSGLVGLKSHILDSETTTDLDALAKKFDVTKENTFVILNKRGAVSFKYTGEISSENLMTKIKEVGDL